MLRPAGGGIHMVSTGRDQQGDLQRTLYGGGNAAEIDARWRGELDRLVSARIVILAIPSDTGAGLVRGAAFGPGALRSEILRRLPDFRRRAHGSGVVDVGDVVVIPQLLHDDMVSDAQRATARAALYASTPDLRARARPELVARLPVSPLSIAAEVVTRLLDINQSLKIVTLGGDHSVTWPVVSSLVAHRKRPFAIVHVDAHTDLMSERLGVKYCFSTWAYHANELIGRSGRLVQVGVRASRHARAHWESTLGVRQFWADEVRARGDAAVIDEIVRHLREIGAAHAYLTNDIDGTDAAAAPATGAPESDGLSVGFVRALTARLGAEVHLVGADLVEVAPPIGAPADAQRTIEVGARYVLDALTALSGSRDFVIS